MNDIKLELDQEKELRISDLFINLINYKLITLSSIIIPLVLSIFYLYDREIYFSAEIEVYENKIIQSSLSSNDYQAPYITYLDTFKFQQDDKNNLDSEKLYNSFISIVRKLDQDSLDSVESNNQYEAILPANILVKEDINVNKAFITFRHKDQENLSTIIGNILSKVNIINKQLLKEDLQDNLYYINILQDDSRERHNEQIDLTKFRVNDKISYLQEIQRKKIDKVIITLRDNLKIAETANITEPIVPSDLQITNSNGFIEWSTSPDRLLETSSEEGIGDRKDSFFFPSSNGEEYANILSSGLPPFFFGSKIIKKELELILDRNNELFTPGLSELELELISLRSQKNDAYNIYLEYLNDLEKNVISQIEILDKFVINDPLSITAIYNIDKLKIDKSSLSSYLIIFISLIIGIIIASMIVTILRVIENSKIK